MTRREKAAAHNRLTRQRSVSRNEIPPLAGKRARHGKCPQKIGMWGTLSTDYRTPSGSTHDKRYSQTLSSRDV